MRGPQSGSTALRRGRRHSRARDQSNSTKSGSRRLRLLVYLAWAHVLLDPHRWLGSVGPSVFHRTETLVLGTLLLVILLKPGRYLKEWRRIVPFALLMVVACVSMPFAANNGLARIGIKALLLYFALGIVTLAEVRSPRHMIPILALLCLQYGWWFLHGGLHGAVPWHPILGNEDSFGPLMVMGFAWTLHYGLAARRGTNERRAAFLLAVASVVGLAASFTRGATLAAGLVAVLIWLRSDRKGAVALAIAAGVITLTVAADTFFAEGAFWAEIQSSFDEGFDHGTGQDRWILWMTAVDVFKHRPVVGVGLNNFGIYAFENLDIEMLAGWYGQTPGAMWGRSTHSIYFQILSETGLVGTFAVLWMMVSFFRNHSHLRSKRIEARWSRDTAGRLKLRPITYGLDAAMLAYLATGFFYDQFISVHWLFTLYITSQLLYHVAARGTSRVRPREPTCPSPVRRHG